MVSLILTTIVHLLGPETLACEPEGPPAQGWVCLSVINAADVITHPIYVGPSSGVQRAVDEWGGQR